MWAVSSEVQKDLKKKIISLGEIDHFTAERWLNERVDLLECVNAKKNKSQNIMIMEQQKKALWISRKQHAIQARKKNRLTPFGFIDFTLAYPDKVLM